MNKVGFSALIGACAIVPGGLIALGVIACFNKPVRDELITTAKNVSDKLGLKIGDKDED
jgi:hypothetical protein